MRRLPVLLGMLLVGTIAWACGDKLMLVMGSRFSQIKPLRPAAILAVPGKSTSAALIRSFQSQPAFKKAGHHLQIVEDTAALDNALKTGKYDVVLADIDSVGELGAQVASAASKPVLLPVAFRASKEEQSAAQKKYHCLLKAPGTTDNYLEAIERAMDIKVKGIAR